MALISGFAKKLMFARELKMGEGRLEIMHQRVIMMPVQFFETMIKMSLKNKKFEKEIYKSLKKSVYEFSKELDKRFTVKGLKFTELLTLLTEMNGYGKVTPTKIDYKNKIAVFHLEDLPSGSLKGKMKGLGDVYWGGIMAGGASYALDANLDCIETKCVLQGNKYCEFVIAPKEVLLKKFNGSKYGKSYKFLLQ